MKITICASCALGQGDFMAMLAEHLAVIGVVADLAKVDCMSGCARASTIAFRAKGKTAYLFGDLTEDDLPDLITFVKAYTVSPDGNFADARLLGALRTKAIARIPA